ncbi:LHFPL tetraspan subfamily member 2 protein [Nilaparvata lugens]|uniref:LHFPL tetraspan subfamily member 2 protein n=1 Tax=Nilaparvata lugens TaxID=108931 RepID=UPI00193E7304|nr:LHFPL tetraspan subfamily member 2 protein [Nilaparvata lugens]
MGHIILTTHSLIWVLLTITATLAVFSGLVSPEWLQSQTPVMYANNTLYMIPSIGIFNRCIKLNNQKNCASFAIDGLSTSSHSFPTLWKTSLIMFVLGLAIMVFTVMTAVLSCCVQSVYKKSIFTVTGTVQAVAGIFYLLGLITYTAGWGCPRMVKLCGEESGPFSKGNCSIGPSLYTALVGTGLTFLTAVLSVKAEKTTSSDRVSHHVEKGETIVCLL